MAAGLARIVVGDSTVVLRRAEKRDLPTLIALLAADGRGLGAAMMRWAIEEARRRRCALVQLTSDKTRLDAHRFYERLGFARSHDGFKLLL